MKEVLLLGAIYLAYEHFKHISSAQKTETFIPDLKNNEVKVGGKKVFRKGEDIQLTKNFHLREFQCKCNYPECVETPVNMTHMNKLQRLRDEVGSPITITSGYRCKRYNEAVGGSPSSQHILGNATDIQSIAHSPFFIANLAESMKFDGLGRYSSFTHLDSRGRLARWDKRPNIGNIA